MERRRSTAWMNRLAGEWFNLGLELLAKKGIEETNYRNEVVKDRLLQSVALIYWEALTGHAKSLGLEIEDIGKRLGLHRSTYNRWIKDETAPHPDKFFGALVVVLKKEIQEVGFPRNREVIWRAVSRTVALIRENECGRDRRLPTREEFASVRWLMRHPFADELVPGNPNSSLVHEVIEDVAYEMKRMFRGGELRTAKAIAQAFGDWAESYLLFRIGLLKGWEFLDEDAV